MRYTTDATAGAMADINIIPLADVLLVLLIVFMVSAPAITDRIGMSLSQPGKGRVEPSPDVVLRIDDAGDVYRDGSLLTEAALSRVLGDIAASAQTADAQPRVTVDASDQADYQSVARVLAATGRAGLRKVSFRQD